MPSPSTIQTAPSSAEPSAADIVISASNLGKMHHLYDRPSDRLKQAFLWGRRQLYREFWALKNVSFDIRRGEVVGIIGRNGSGKSTLLQILAGVLRPSTGQVRVRGRVAALLELGSGFNPDFTGRENVFMNAAILGLSPQQIADRFDQIVQFADIGQFINQPVKTYSSGMYVRLAFAIAMHVDPEILVVDEALAVGDAAFQFKCLHHLEQLLQRGVTILLVSHDTQLVKSYCSRAIYLRNGQLQFQGDCETATELFLMHMRAEQRAHLDSQIQLKPPVGGQGGLRFGNDRGHILHVSIGSESEPRTFFQTGQRIWIDVTAKVAPDIRSPRLAIVLRDLRGYNIFGFNSSASPHPLTPTPDGLISGRFSFNCALQAGDYSITLRLEDYFSESVNLLLDKQVNATNFKVLAPKHTFDGVADLNGAFNATTSPQPI